MKKSSSHQEELPPPSWMTDVLSVMEGATWPHCDRGKERKKWNESWLAGLAAARSDDVVRLEVCHVFLCFIKFRRSWDMGYWKFPRGWPHPHLDLYFRRWLRRSLSLLTDRHQMPATIQLSSLFYWTISHFRFYCVVNWPIPHDWAELRPKNCIVGFQWEAHSAPGLVVVLSLVPGKKLTWLKDWCPAPNVVQVGSSHTKWTILKCLFFSNLGTNKCWLIMSKREGRIQ